MAAFLLGHDYNIVKFLVYFSYLIELILDL